MFILRISVKLLSVFEDVEIAARSCHPHSSGAMFVRYGDQDIIAQAWTDVHTCVVG